MIYEIREYTTVPGRMPALVKRFEDHTLRFFERMGVEVTFISLTERAASEADGPLVARIGRRVLNPGVFA